MFFSLGVLETTAVRLARIRTNMFPPMTIEDDETSSSDSETDQEDEEEDEGVGPSPEVDAANSASVEGLTDFVIRAKNGFTMNEWEISTKIGGSVDLRGDGEIQSTLVVYSDGVWRKHDDATVSLNDAHKRVLSTISYEIGQKYVTYDSRIILGLIKVTL